MQTENLLDTDVFETTITDESGNQLNGISLWMRINAITAFASMAVTIITTIWTFIQISSLGFGNAMGGAEIFRLIISVTISLVLNILLLQAASGIKKGIAMQDQQSFNMGLLKMATYFKTMGILIIVGMSLMILFFIFAVLTR